MRLFSRLKYVLISIVLGLLAACTTTGNSFNAAGLSSIMVGQTTLAQAAEYLQAEPVDIWQQGNSTLARWAFRGTVATDAIYMRQEAWLRFGADGTFERVDKTINVPFLYQPKPEPENSASVNNGVTGDDQQIDIDVWIEPDPQTDLNDWVPARSDTSLSDW